MAGAAAFSARAAYRTGSGLVKVVTEECNREIIQTLAPEAVLAVYTEETEMEASSGSSLPGQTRWRPVQGWAARRRRRKPCARFCRRQRFPVFWMRTR